MNNHRIKWYLGDQCPTVRLWGAPLPGDDQDDFGPSEDDEGQDKGKCKRKHRRKPSESEIVDKSDNSNDDEGNDHGDKLVKCWWRDGDTPPELPSSPELAEWLEEG